MVIELPWYRVSAREARADTVFGQCRIVGGTCPPWHKVTAGSLTLGYTLYFGSKRIGWTVHALDAERTLSGLVGAEVLKREMQRTAK